MAVETIRSIFGYDSSATEKMLSCCDRLDPAQLTQADDSPHGSIRNQLVHTFLIHKRWLSWADGSLDGAAAYALQADPADYPDIQAIRAMWDGIDEQTRQFLGGMTEQDLHHELRVDQPGFEFAITIEKVMLHIALHSMQHRTETAQSLTRLGVSPGDVDYLFYVLENG